MQFFILLTGVMVFVFYQFQPHDVLFDTTSLELVEGTDYKDDLDELRTAHYEIHAEKKEAALQLLEEQRNGTEESTLLAQENLNALKTQAFEKRDEAKSLVEQAFPNNTQKDSDYVFISYILNFMPSGLVGLLLAVIISAAMSSTAGELNALGSTTSVDFYKRIIKQDGDDRHYLIMSKVLTAFWGVLAVGFALYADLFENLIEAVNILGSLFYGTILGIFLTAFFLKRVKGNAVFIAAAIAQTTILILYTFQSENISYLYFNVIGCGLVMILSYIFSMIEGNKKAINV
jgi:Na+(H+)/acetate symporter ActP